MYDTFRKSFKFFDIPMSFIAGRTIRHERNCLKDRHPLKHLFYRNCGRARSFEQVFWRAEKNTVGYIPVSKKNSAK